MSHDKTESVDWKPDELGNNIQFGNELDKND